MRWFLETYHFYRVAQAIPGGSLDDAPAWWVHWARVMDDELAQIEKERIEALKREQGRN